MLDISVHLFSSIEGLDFYAFKEDSIPAFIFHVHYLCTNKIAPAVIIHYEINQRIALSGYFLCNSIRAWWSHTLLSAFAGYISIDVIPLFREQMSANTAFMDFELQNASDKITNRRCMEWTHENTAVYMITLRLCTHHSIPRVWDRTKQY